MSFLINFKQEFINLYKKILVIIFLLILLVFFIKTSNIFVYKIINKYFVTLCFLFFLLSFINTLNNQHLNIKNNSFSQKFYKRSYTAFWIIEFFLFFIMLFLTLMVQNTSLMSYDVHNVIIIIFSNWYNFFFTLILLIFNGLILNLIILIKNSVKKLYEFLVIIMLCNTIYLLLYEYLKLYTLLYFFRYSDLDTSTKANKTINNLINKLNTSYYKKKDTRMRTQNFYILLLTLLKFWHIVIVLIGLMLLIAKYTWTLNLSNDILSMNLQNIIYMFFFSFLIYLLFFKKLGKRYFKHMLKIIYENEKHNGKFFYKTNMEFYIFVKELFYFVIN